MGTRIAVGEIYPLFEKSMKQMKGKDGAVFEAMSMGDGYVFTVFYNQPLAAETEIFSQKPIHVRLLIEHPFCLPLIQFGDTRMLFEMSLDPTLYQDKRATQFISINNLCTFVLVDSQSGIVRSLRASNFPLRMITLCAQYWAHAFDVPNYSAQYLAWYQNKQNIPLEKLWTQALDVGKMGESFNVHELKTE